MVAIVFSSLALAAAVGCVIGCVLFERKRSRELRAADEQFHRQVEEMLIERVKKMDRQWREKATEMEASIRALENGTVPDYEKAREAAKAVDEFHQGLANILNYDPYELAKKNREGED